MILDRMALWRAGNAALMESEADDASRRVWERIGLALSPLVDASWDDCLDGAAESLSLIDSPAARQYALACRSLAGQFRSGSLSEDELCDLTSRLESTDFTPQIRRLGKVLRALGVLHLLGEKEKNLLSSGLELMDAPPERRFRLTADLLVQRSPLDEVYHPAAGALIEALLLEINRQRRMMLGQV